jgi:DNA-binding SARP family transcriptional activator
VYSLRPGADLWLDASEFLRLRRQAEALLVAQPQAALPLLQQAVDLYQGEYLPDARYETWAAAERERLEVLFLRLADHLAELYLAGGRLEEAISLCQRILLTDNCWERAYRLLMVAYDRLGDHGQVARAYIRCCQVLQEELEVSPAAETEALYHRLVAKS